MTPKYRKKHIPKIFIISLRRSPPFPFPLLLLSSSFSWKQISIGIGISFKYPFKAATAAADGAAVEKREKDAISFRYPIFDVADGTTTQGDVEKRDKDAISFTYPIFKVAEGADGGDVEKREPKSPYADTIAAADPRDILG